MAKQQFSDELELLKKYIQSPDNEDAKRPLLFPLFRKLFKDKFLTESATYGADGYVEGQLIIEAKSNYSDWLKGFYQALMYNRKHGLSYTTILVIAHEFVGVWKLDKLPESVTTFIQTADLSKAPSAIGTDLARKSQKPLQAEIIAASQYWLDPKKLHGNLFTDFRGITYEIFEILQILRNLDSSRTQINPHNFINTIQSMRHYFDKPIDAVHAFYTMIYFWDITSKLIFNEDDNEVRLIGYNGNKYSKSILIEQKYFSDFKKFVEGKFIFKNEGSGLTVDYYFSRFDEVMATIDAEYVKQHGIFFTDDSLSKFALWYAKHHFPANINEDFVVFDPAAGSGNLVCSWRGKLKHKIVSELQPDLLKTIEKRMQADPFHIEHGFTIIPRTADNKGLNFLDCSADEYFTRLQNETQTKNISLDKPLAFLLNPPYKNTDENESIREASDSNYTIHPDILKLAGNDAKSERYLAFLGQILNLSKYQHEKYGVSPIVMIFTPTSWLIPRPTYVHFRKEWDSYFEFHSGFITTSNQFFKLNGKWPLAFTIWQFRDKPTDENTNNIQVLDLTHLQKQHLAINWFADDNYIETTLNEMVKNAKIIPLSFNKKDIRETLPLLERKGVMVKQPRLNIYRNKTKEEQAKNIISGFPLNDERHKTIKDPYGFSDGNIIGFMDDNTPVRIKQEPSNRLSNLPDRIWFRLDIAYADINKTRVVSSTPSIKGFCAYDLASAKATCSWFGITKALNNNYPTWANQYDIWAPQLPTNKEAVWYALCFAFVLAENRCVVTKFEKDNPIVGAPEIFVDNPLSTNNTNSFWRTTLLPFIEENKKQLENDVQGKLALQLIDAITQLYTTWNKNYAKGQFLLHVGLQNEPYFKYFSYADFLTKDSGLIQIKKYARQESLTDMLQHIDVVQKLTIEVKTAMSNFLVNDCKYFE